MSRISDPHQSETGPEQLPNNGKSILLAEDDPFISRMYQTKLIHAGYDVKLVNNGRDAYEQIKSTHPDLIMLDINMPELSGFEVIKALQGDTDVFDASKIMILTNSADPADRQAATDMGADYFVKADMTPHEILDRINTKLGIA